MNELINANSKSMTVEEKLVQYVKDNTLFQILGDEDMIREVMLRAINEALIQPQRIKENSYGRDTYIQKDSILIEVCRSIAKEHAQVVAKQVVDEALARDDVKDAIFNAMIAAIPAALDGYLNSQMRMLQQNTATKTIDGIRELRRSGHGGI